MHTGLMLSAHAHNIEYNGLVKVVNNAIGTLIAQSARGVCALVIKHHQTLIYHRVSRLYE